MLIRKHRLQIVQGGTSYAVWICGEEDPDGTWKGWLEFHPVNAPEPILATDQETSQPNRDAIEYWANGLEPTYLEGALARAEGRLL